MDKHSLVLFNSHKVRRVWDAEKEFWYFSVVDVIAVLTESKDPRNYWKVLKNRLKQEGSEVVTKCNQLKMMSSDGKFYETDAADTETLLRLIQSVPSPNAEPFKIWLAKVGYERLEEMSDPELAINRALQNYLKLGYSKEWINQRLKSIEVRKELTDEWERVGVKQGLEFAILTDEITKAWSDMTTKEYKNLKSLKKENLRDNMSNLELVLNMLAEVTTKEISETENPDTFERSRSVARKGGAVAGNARKEIEQKTGRKVSTSKNAKELRNLGKRKMLENEV